MRMTVGPARRYVAQLVLLAAAALPAVDASAQSMSPMRGEVTSFSDEFALKVFPRNVYPHRIGIEMRAYDQDFRPIKAFIMPDRFRLATQDVRAVTVIVPFDGENERRIRVCAESVPLMNKQSRVRTQICGKFLARRAQ